MKRFYRCALIAAAAATVWAQDRPAFDRENADAAMQRAREAMELAQQKMADLHFNLDLDLEPALLAQKVATDVTEKVNEKVAEKMEQMKWQFNMDRMHDLYSRGMDALDRRDIARVVVPERRTHLPRIEIEIRPAVDVPHD